MGAWRTPVRLLRPRLAENSLKFEMKINFAVEIFLIILFLYFLEKLYCITKKNQFISSDDHKNHVLMIFNQLTSYVEDVLKSYILNEILLVTWILHRLQPYCKQSFSTKQIDPTILYQ